MATGDMAPVVGTNTLIAMPLARPPWNASADAQLAPWPSGPSGDGDPVFIARVGIVDSLERALRCGVAAVWAEPVVDATEAADALCAVAPTAQLIVEVDPGRPDRQLEAQLLGVARLAAPRGITPARLALAIRATPDVAVASLLATWRSHALLRRHPLVVTIPTATPPAVRAGLLAVAAMAHSAVATDDVRGARRVAEVIGAIQQHGASDPHNDTEPHDDTERHGDKGGQR